jgi:hypothetical protein
MEVLVTSTPSIAEANRIEGALIGIHNRTLGHYLPDIHRIPISATPTPQPRATTETNRTELVLYLAAMRSIPIQGDDPIGSQPVPSIRLQRISE